MPEHCGTTNALLVSAYGRWESVQPVDVAGRRRKLARAWHRRALAARWRVSTIRHRRARGGVVCSAAVSRHHGTVACSCERPHPARLHEARSRWRAGLHVRESILLEVPIADVYTFWRRLENLPRFMTHLDRVTEASDGTSHRVAAGPAGLSVDAESINEVENKVLAWRAPWIRRRHRRLGELRRPANCSSASNAVTSIRPSSSRTGSVSKMPRPCIARFATNTMRASRSS
jgi:Polyketide cyclase / dehydrase and lipid transport